jgi:NAD(P) transhydrogenase subunit alpha
MIIGVLKEHSPETRVSLLPEHVVLLQKKNAIVWIEQEAGKAAFALDESYKTAGAEIKDRSAILSAADVILSINPIAVSELSESKNKILLGLFQVLSNGQQLADLSAAGHTVFSIEMLPRTTRAQSMDVLSSQANIAGYKAVLTAANALPHYFPMFMTAAGSIPPVKLLVLGAGVAGLQAIATARRLGAVVEVFDTRPAVKEEVMSLGAKFVEVEGAADASQAGGYAVAQSKEFLAKQKAKIAERVAKSDVIITTAQIPGRKAPILITDEMMQNMKTGSVIVDLAASTGGNTSHTANDATITYEGVTIIGNSNLPATMPSDASKLYGKNICNFLALIIKDDGSLHLNFEDDLVKETCVAHNGTITNERVKTVLNQPA